MSYRSLVLLLVGCCLLRCAKAMFPYNITNTNKLLCYSCQGSHCETISNEDDNVVVCNKHTQLCWAGFVDQQPYRTCASRYCTPSGISLDSDIRIETCCHASLCNSVPLSFGIWSKWFRRTTTQRPETPPPATTRAAIRQTTATPVSTRRTTTTTPRLYIVNEMVNNKRLSFVVDGEESDERDGPLPAWAALNASDPASFGITWERVPFHNGFSNRVAFISKSLVLFMPVTLVLLL